MAFTLYGTTFVDGVTVVPAAFLNKLRTELPSAVDGRGGSYSNSSELYLAGAGADIRIGGDSLVRLTPTGGTRIETAVRFDSTVLINSSAWPTFSSRTFQLWEIPREVGNDDSDHPVAYTDAGKPTLSFAARTLANTTLISVPKCPHQGALLVNVYVLTKGHSWGGGGTLNYPSYQVQRTSLGNPGIASWGSLTTLSTVTADAHSAGNWQTTYVETTIAVTGSPAMTPQTATYHLMVNNPYAAADSAGMFIAAVGAQYTVGELRY